MIPIYPHCKVLGKGHWTHQNCAGAKAKAANRPGQDRLVHRKICWTHHDPVGQSPVSPCKRWIRLTFGILHVQFFGHLR